MYKRFSENESIDRMKKYLIHDRPFVMACSLLFKYTSMDDELNPEEIWTEAKKFTSKLFGTEYPDFLVYNIGTKLNSRYLSFKSADGTSSVKRSREKAQHTTLLVLWSAVLWLSEAGQSKECQKMMSAILKNISLHPKFEQLMDDFRHQEIINEHNGFVADTSKKLSDLCDGSQDEQTIESVLTNLVDTAEKFGRETIVYLLPMLYEFQRKCPSTSIDEVIEYARSRCFDFDKNHQAATNQTISGSNVFNGEVKNPTFMLPEDWDKNGKLVNDYGQIPPEEQ